MTQNSEVISRKTALDAGFTHYFTGKPCKQGHVSKRYADSGTCVACADMRRRARAAARPKRILKGRDMENMARLRREHYERNREAYITRAAEWRQMNHERRKEIARQWVRDNPAKSLAAVRKRQAAKQQRTPAWADLEAITQMYLKCPPGFQVDHIIPLRGKLVSGLHVHNNLQYLTKTANLKKLNKFDPDTFTS